MIANNMVILVWLVLVITGSMGGCECQRDVMVDDGPQIERPTMAEIDPHAERPYTQFSSDLRTDDVSLNKFVERALKICEEGDYDAFRQLFGTTYTPTEQKAFERVWHNVRDIRVGSLNFGKNDSNVYYLHAMVRLRKPDRKKRQERDIVVTIFKEAGDWHLGPAPKEVVEKVLEINQQTDSEQRPSAVNPP